MFETCLGVVEARLNAERELRLDTCSQSVICLLYSSAMCSGTNSVPHPLCFTTKL